MSRGFPSMTALLGLLAVAGFQNRDKITEMLSGGGGGQQDRIPDRHAQDLGSDRMRDRSMDDRSMSDRSMDDRSMGGRPMREASGSSSGGLDGILGNLRDSLGGLLGGAAGGAGGRAGAGGILSGGLGELADRFKRAGQTDTMESWVGRGQNRDIPEPQLEQAIGPDVVEELVRQTGLPREELLRRLSRELPRAVDEYTPHGRLPTEDDFAMPGEDAVRRGQDNPWQRR